MNSVLNFLIENNLKSVLDIGANVGEYSSSIKTLIKELDIFMIEANPFCESFLKTTDIPYKIACLSNTKKKIPLHINPKNLVCTGVSYYQEQTKHYSDGLTMLVDSCLLDEIILDEFGYQKSFEFIKMDTQGSEIDIILGGYETVKKAKHVQIETSLIEYNKGSPLKEQVINFMRELGFYQNILTQIHYLNQNPETNTIIQEDWIFSR